jgi:hypothetical protein
VERLRAELRGGASATVADGAAADADRYPRLAASAEDRTAPDRSLSDVAESYPTSDRETHRRLDALREEIRRLRGGRAPAAEGGQAALPFPPGDEPASVQLRGPEGRPLVCGVEKPPLSPGAYSIVGALLKAYPGGLTKVELERDGDKTDPHKWLAKLSADPDWERAIHRPGRGVRDGYRIRSLAAASALR